MNQEATDYPESCSDLNNTAAKNRFDEIQMENLSTARSTQQKSHTVKFLYCGS